ncbi:hypothetical protein, partial [Aneurinibacillus aneurinilyticus]
GSKSENYAKRSNGCTGTNNESKKMGIDENLKTEKMELKEPINFIDTYNKPEVLSNNFKLPSSVAYDSIEDALYITDERGSKVIKFKNKKISSFIEPGSGKDNVIKPDYLSIDSKGYLWLLEKESSKVKIFNSSGKEIHSFSLDETEMIHNMFVHDNNIYISYNNKIIKYDKFGKRLLEIEEPFIKSMAIAHNSLYLLRNDITYEDKHYNEAFIKYSLDGKKIQDLPIEGKGNGGLVFNPNDQKLYLFTSEKKLCQIDQDGKIIATVYNDPPKNRYEFLEKLSFGNQFVFDKENNIYTTNLYLHEVYLIKRK